MSISWLIVPLLAVVGVTIVREDLRRSVIPNWRVVNGLYVAAGFYALAVLLAFVLPEGTLGLHFPTQPLRWVGAQLLQAMLALLIGYGLYHFEVWPAGDAKFFALLCLFLPSDLWDAPKFNQLLAGVLLVNTFVAAATFSIGLSLSRMFLRVVLRRRSAWAQFRTGVELRQQLATMLRMMLVALVAIIFIRFLRGIAREVFGQVIDVNTYAFYLLLFVICEPLGRHLGKRWVQVVFAGAMLSGLGWHAWHGNAQAAFVMFIQSVGISASIAAARGLLIWIVREVDYRPVDAEALAPGDVLHDDTVEKIQADPDYQQSWQGPIGEIKRKALTREQVDDIRAWYLHGLAHGNNQFPLALRHRFAFALWLVVGAGLTLALRGDLFRLIELRLFS